MTTLHLFGGVDSANVTVVAIDGVAIALTRVADASTVSRAAGWSLPL